MKIFLTDHYRLFLRAGLFALCVAVCLSTPALGFLGSGGGNCVNGSGSGLDDTCNTCINSAIFTNDFSGYEIINSVFGAINTVINNVQYSFFQGIINGTGFQVAIGVALILYIAIYGIMLTMGLVSAHLSDIAIRMLKIAFIYLMTSPAAWSSFTNWVNTPIIGGMNQLIREFTATAESGSGYTTIINITTGSGSGSGSCLTYGTSGGSGLVTGLDCNSFTSMFGAPMTQLFAAKYFTAILSLITTGFFGWLIAIFLAWALIEFFMMMLNAIITYATSIIGLAFLLGIAPIFFIFLIFDQTRNVFFGWLNQVLSLALQPILLFAFLSFYVAIINQALPELIMDPNKIPTEFCWVKWFSMPGALWDVYMWRPTLSGGIVINDWVCASGITCPEPINVINVLYFLLICHLGKSFGSFIKTLASDLTGGAFIDADAAALAQTVANTGAGAMKRTAGGVTRSRSPRK